MPDGKKIYGYDEELWFEVLKQQQNTGERDLGTIVATLESYGVGVGKEIVDLGCGTGRISNRLAKVGYFVTGIDLSLKCVEEASRLAQELGVSDKTRYLIGDYRNVEIFSGKKYDAALCILAPAWNSTEEMSGALTKLSGIVRRGGILLLRESVKERFLVSMAVAPSTQNWFRFSGDLLSLHRWDYDQSKSKVRAVKEFYRKDEKDASLRLLTKIEQEYTLRTMAEYINAFQSAGWEVCNVLADSVDLLNLVKYNDPWWAFSALFVARSR